jgi:hypothetical protein
MLLHHPGYEYSEGIIGWLSGGRKAGGPFHRESPNVALIPMLTDASVDRGAAFTALMPALRLGQLDEPAVGKGC